MIHWWMIPAAFAFGLLGSSWLLLWACPWGRRAGYTPNPERPIGNPRLPRGSGVIPAPPLTVHIRAADLDEKFWRDHQGAIVEAMKAPEACPACRGLGHFNDPDIGPCGCCNGTGRAP